MCVGKRSSALMLLVSSLFAYSFTYAGVNCSSFIAKPKPSIQVPFPERRWIDPTRMTLFVGMVWREAGKSTNIEGVDFNVIAVESSRGPSVSLSTRTPIDPILMAQIKRKIAKLVEELYLTFLIEGLFPTTPRIPDAKIVLLDRFDSPTHRVDPAEFLKIKIFAETRVKEAEELLPREEVTIVTIQISRHHEISIPLAVFLGENI